MTSQQSFEILPIVHWTRSMRTNWTRGHLYILALEYIHEMANNVDHFLMPTLNYVDNNHKPFMDVQIEEFRMIHSHLSEKLISTINVYKNDDQQGAAELLIKMEDFVKLIRSTRKKQIKRIKNREIGTRNSLLYLALLGELRNVGWYASRLVKVYSDLILSREDDQLAKASELESSENDIIEPEQLE